MYYLLTEGTFTGDTLLPKNGRETSQDSNTPSSADDIDKASYATISMASTKKVFQTMFGFGAVKVHISPLNKEDVESGGPASSS